MNHVVLLGDSIFDNEGYVNGGLTVIDHLKSLLSPSWKATLLAKDGSTTREIADQLLRLPSDTTHIMVNAGGNNALSQMAIKTDPHPNPLPVREFEVISIMSTPYIWW
jgi:hypothetical protein